ncbi:Flp family type IVb pilin [Pedococcus bigeumensis]|jgi:pilus assembly protein Flp/PilA|uniref:Flp family type IVb pilin n=1 Tax=Pedococcus bigeumensis TaxID=433644 RepID=A0A502D2E1_9MICO|nr:Flp family type IVb pilin [Pedococcus bigeumensis]TPG19243.1 Flp family type IVb pilin [Pedococcus bigeumensis]
MKNLRHRPTHPGSWTASRAAVSFAGAARPIAAAFRGRVSRPDHGATAVEYGLMVALIAIVIIGGVALFGQSVSALFVIPAGVL